MNSDLIFWIMLLLLYWLAIVQFDIDKMKKKKEKKRKENDNAKIVQFTII